MSKMAMMVLVASSLNFVTQVAVAGPDAEAIFKKKCVFCHSVDKKKFGPSLKDMDKDEKVLTEVINKGRKAMPKWGKKLSAEEISALVALIKSKQ